MRNLRFDFYGLSDPELPEIFRYVGMTTDLLTREKFHSAEPQSPRAVTCVRKLWIKALCVSGRRPLFTPLTTGGRVLRYKDGTTHSRELKLIQQEQARHGAILNREAVRANRKAVGVTQAIYWGYLHTSTAALFGDEIAWRNVAELERDYPTVFHVFSFGTLRELVRI